jgi:hypothetical protein
MIKLGKAEEVAVKVDVLTSHFDLPVTKRIAVKLRQESGITTFELNKRARRLAFVA